MEIYDPKGAAMAKEEPRSVQRVERVGALTVADLVDWCMSHEVAPMAVMVTGTHLKWTSPETEEEAIRRIDHEERAKERTADWERQMYARLKARFEPEDGPGE